MLACQLTVEHCRAYRAFRRTQLCNGKPIEHTTINREISKISRSFKIAMPLGKVSSMPPGGCDFWKKPETQNTRRVRLPDRYYEFFRDALHPALKCAYVLGYHIGRRKTDILKIQWNQIDFDERCIYFDVTKTGPVKCPFMGEMEKILREQKTLRDQLSPWNPRVCFWFDLRSDKEGEPMKRFDTNWKHAVDALKKKMIADGVEPIDLHFHDLRRSAHYQMRKVGVDSLTRRAIMGHKTDSMDTRYGMIDEEAIDDARAKMEGYHQRQGLPNQTDEVVALKAEIAALKARVAPVEHTAGGARTRKSGLVLVRGKKA
jgi:integrase